MSVLARDTRRRMKPHPKIDTAMLCCEHVVVPAFHLSGTLLLAEWKCPTCGETCHQQLGQLQPERARVTVRGRPPE